MQKFLISAAIAASLAVASFASHADDANGHFFVNAGAGQSSYRVGGLNDKSDLGYDMNLGYRWAISPVLDLGLEGGYVVLGEGKFNTADANSTLKSRGWTAGVNAKINITDKFYGIVRFGNFASKTMLNTTSMGEAVHQSSSDKGGYYGGLGLGYNILSNLSVGVNYDNYHGHAQKFSDVASNAGVYTASVEFRY
jgi:opacity protein-like surface antigen